MPKEIPAVHQGGTILRYGVSLKFGIAPFTTGRCSALRALRARSTPQLVPPVPGLDERKRVLNEQRRSAFIHAGRGVRGGPYRLLRPSDAD